MHKKPLVLAALAIAALSAAPVASAYEIRFEDAYTSSWQEIAAGYGSVAGVADVSYWDVQRSTNNFRFWDGSYSGGPAAFAGFSEAGSIGQLTFTPVGGGAVTLNSFFLGSYVNADRNSSFYVDDLATAGIDYTSGSIVIGASGLTFSPNFTSTVGIVIGFGPDAYNVGINNIRFNVTPVPEPETYALLLAGLGLMGAVARRRRTV